MTVDEFSVSITKPGALTAKQAFQMLSALGDTAVITEGPGPTYGARFNVASGHAVNALTIAAGKMRRAELNAGLLGFNPIVECTATCV